ncbi:unnamed protein product [Amoebophrya sp. A25]|nr:unnamed protein product [Amoebophrya sp. A25]|eukprot:GSA25T00024201001.1
MVISSVLLDASSASWGWGAAPTKSSSSSSSFFGLWSDFDGGNCPREEGIGMLRRANGLPVAIQHPPHPRIRESRRTAFSVAIEPPIVKGLGCQSGILRAKFDPATGEFRGLIQQPGTITAKLKDGEFERATLAQGEDTENDNAAKGSEEAAKDDDEADEEPEEQPAAPPPAQVPIATTPHGAVFGFGGEGGQA